MNIGVMMKGRIINLRESSVLSACFPRQKRRRFNGTDIEDHLPPACVASIGKKMVREANDARRDGRSFIPPISARAPSGDAST